MTDLERKSTVEVEKDLEDAPLLADGDEVPLPPSIDGASALVSPRTPESALSSFLETLMFISKIQKTEVPEAFSEGVALTVALVRGESNGEVSSLLMLAALLLGLGMVFIMAVGFALSLDHPKVLDKVCMLTNLFKVLFGVFVAVICRGAAVGICLAVLLTVSAIAGEVQRYQIGENISFAAALLRTLLDGFNPSQHNPNSADASQADRTARRRAVRQVTFVLLMLYVAQVFYLVGWAAMAGRAVGSKNRFWLLAALVVLLYWPVSVFRTLAYGVSGSTMVRYLYAASGKTTPHAAKSAPTSSPSPRTRQKGESGLMVTVFTLLGPNFGTVCRCALFSPLSMHVASPLIWAMCWRPQNSTASPISNRNESCTKKCHRSVDEVYRGLRGIQDLAPRFAMVYVGIYGLAFRPAAEMVQKAHSRLSETSKCGEPALFLVQNLCELFMLLTGVVFIGLSYRHFQDAESVEEYVLAGFGIGVSVLLWVEGFWQGLIDGLVVHFSTRPDDVAALMPSVYPRLRRLSAQEDLDDWY